MSNLKMKLTKTSVATVDPVGGKQLLIWDTEMRGFGLRVSPGGAKSYILQRRLAGTKRSLRITIGRADDLATEAARRKALAIASQLAEGVDPAKEKARVAARSLTVQQAFRDYMEAPKKKGIGRGGPKKKRTQRDIAKCMKYFSDWMKLPVTNITGAMVKKRHSEIAKASPAQADLAFRYLRAAFNHVVADSEDENDPIIKKNPVDRLNRLNQWSEKKCARGHIPADRIGDWLDAVRDGLYGLKNDMSVRDALVFMLLTGARLSEVIGSPPDDYPALRWRDVDLVKRAVTFRDTKNRKDHTLPLPIFLAAMLERRKQISGPEFVFSNSAGDVPLELRGAYARIKALTGIYVTAHDLRRTFTTAASWLDISAYKTKALANHMSGNDVTAGYIQIDAEDLRDAMQRIEDYMLSPNRRPVEQNIVLQLEDRSDDT